MDSKPGPYGSRAVWVRSAFAVETDGTWTAMPVHQVAMTLHAQGSTPAAAFDALATRYRELADEIDDGGELLLEPHGRTAGKPER